MLSRIRTNCFQKFSSFQRSCPAFSCDRQDPIYGPILSEDQLHFGNTFTEMMGDPMDIDDSPVVPTVKSSAKGKGKAPATKQDDGKENLPW